MPIKAPLLPKSPQIRDNSIVEDYELLEKRAVKLEAELREISPAHRLVGILKQEGASIAYNKEKFVKLYRGSTFIGGLQRYINDLEGVLKGSRDHNN